MKKEEAQKRLTAIEVEVKELRKIIQDADVPKDITDRVKTLEDACGVLGIKTYGDAYRLLKLDRSLFADTPIDQCDDEWLALEIICLALNEGWVPDWTNSSQYKYYPYFRMSPFGFAAAAYEGWITYSSGGSRLCFKSNELAKYAGKQFIDRYKKILTF